MNVLDRVARVFVRPSLCIKVPIDIFPKGNAFFLNVQIWRHERTCILSQKLLGALLAAFKFDNLKFKSSGYYYPVGTSSPHSCFRLSYKTFSVLMPLTTHSSCHHILTLAIPQLSNLKSLSCLSHSFIILTSLLLAQ